MSKHKKSSGKSIPNFGFWDAQGAVIDLWRIPDEDGNIIHHAHFSIILESGKTPDDVKVVTLGTRIAHPCKFTAAVAAANYILGLIGFLSRIVTVFDLESGEAVEEFTIVDAAHSLGDTDFEVLNPVLH